MPKKISDGTKTKVAEEPEPADGAGLDLGIEQRVVDRSMTFDDCRDAYLCAHEGGWRHPKHRKNWAGTLFTYVTPVFGSIPVQDVNVALIAKVLEPIWTSKRHTAIQIRGRIEMVLDWAEQQGFRTGENPGRWRGNLDQFLPAVPGRIRKGEHYAALPYDQLGSFMNDLRGREGSSAAALEFLILTATRPGQVIGARWPEIHFTKRIWTIPAGRVQSGTEHRVPLSKSALAVLKRMKGRSGDFIFGSREAGKPLAQTAMFAVLERMSRSDITADGFRMTFRDWAAERTSFAYEIVEMALAHVTLHKAEEANYTRGRLFRERRRLMDAWADLCKPP
jgi:integrase